MNKGFDFIEYFIITFGSLLLISKILNEPISLKNTKIYFSILVSLIFCFLLSYIPSSIRFFLLFFFWIIIASFTFSCSIKKSFACVSLLYVLLICCETVLVPFTVSLGSYNLKLISNLIIFLASYYLLDLSLIKQLRNYLMENQPKILFPILFIVFLFVIITTLYQSQVNFSIFLFLGMNLFGFLVLVLIISLLLEKNKIQKMNDNYQVFFETIKNYEHLLDQQRILNHENKNRLLTLKTLVKEKKVREYIDTLLEESGKNDIAQSFLTEVSNIPFSMMRGFLYYKYLDAEKLNIDFKLEVGKKVRTMKEDSLTNKELSSLLKIMGVFLDNALQEVEQAKEKEVKVNVFKEKDRLLIMIANTFTNKISSTRNLAGTTTKGKGHGYGLLLVEELLKKNPKMENETEIISNVFVQTISIKLE